jgi:hypothetical protein
MSGQEITDRFQYMHALCYVDHSNQLRCLFRGEAVAKCCYAEQWRSDCLRADNSACDLEEIEFGAQW